MIGGDINHMLENHHSRVAVKLSIDTWLLFFTTSRNIFVEKANDGWFWLIYG